MSLFGGASKIDNRLQERSKLIFEFPTNESNATLDRVCPFFENPIISEKKSSNLIKYDVLGRTSNFLAYTGAKSKSYSVQFDMTLAHITNMATNELFGGVPIPPTKLQKQAAFFETKEGFPSPKSKKTESTYNRKRRSFMKKVNGGVSLADAAAPVAAAAAVGALFGTQLTTGAADLVDTTPEVDLATDLRAYSKDKGGSIYGQALDIMLYWIELIRMSSLTSRQQPTLGPPIIRLVHGVLYDHVATVLESYSISMDEAAGYDIVTLLPQKVKITLNLIQIQRNNDPRDMTNVRQRDEMKGWDDLLIDSDPVLSAGWQGLYFDEE
jgi:hypothetical protein|tara:strand:+ start:9029 stop:10003 length:975 start_codon:yes stop_codon:yes gene_type:complete